MNITFKKLNIQLSIQNQLLVKTGEPSQSSGVVFPLADAPLPLAVISASISIPFSAIAASSSRRPAPNALPPPPTLSSTLLTGGGPTSERITGISISPTSSENTMVPKMRRKKVRMMTDL